MRRSPGTPAQPLDRDAAGARSLAGRQDQAVGSHQFLSLRLEPVKPAPPAHLPLIPLDLLCLLAQPLGLGASRAPLLCLLLALLTRPLGRDLGVGRAAAMLLGRVV